MASLHTVLADAVLARLAAALPAIPRQRARRAEVERGERPLLVVSMGEMQADPFTSPAEVFWSCNFMVTGFAASAASDAVAEDNVGAIAAQIVAALDGQPLERPGGGDLTTGVFALSVEPRLYSTEESAAPMGEATVTFRATVPLPAGVLTL